MTAEPLDLSVRMSDGVRIAMHRYASGTSSAPVVLAVVPYRKENAGVTQLAHLINKAGYVFCVADVRGFGGSVAPYEGLLSPREIEDGAELIAWIARQRWCDGRVALMGGSYFGANQLLIAARRPQGLRCIAPFTAPVDTYRDWTHRGGIPSHPLWGADTYLRSGQPGTVRRGLAQYYLELLDDHCDNDAHRARSPETVLSEIEVPALCLGGWDDYFLRGTIRAYHGIRTSKRLVIGPWGHGGFGSVHVAELIAWLGFWLRGEGPDPTRQPVRVFIRGAEQWADFDEWPAITGAYRSLHPVSEPTRIRVLTTPSAVPAAPNPRPGLVQDPTGSGIGLWGEDVALDMPPFESPVMVIGPPALHLVLTAGCSDVDVHARVSVISSAGTATQVTEGRLRASHRAIDPDRSLHSADGDVIVPWHTHTVPEPLHGREAVRLDIELDPVAYRFQAGDRMRLGLTLVRSDDGGRQASAQLDPSTRLLLPVQEASSPWRDGVAPE